MADLSLKHNSTWKPPQTVHVKKSGAWVPAQAVYSKYNGIWVQCWPPSFSFINISGTYSDTSSIGPQTKIDSNTSNHWIYSRVNGASVLNQLGHITRFKPSLKYTSISGQTAAWTDFGLTSTNFVEWSTNTNFLNVGMGSENDYLTTTISATSPDIIPNNSPHDFYSVTINIPELYLLVGISTFISSQAGPSYGYERLPLGCKLQLAIVKPPHTLGTLTRTGSSSVVTSTQTAHPLTGVTCDVGVPAGNVVTAVEFGVGAYADLVLNNTISANAEITLKTSLTYQPATFV